MPATTDHETEPTTEYVASLLEKLPLLLSKNQPLAVLCNFYWALHSAERGFLNHADTIQQLIQQIPSVLPLCAHEEKITVYERLLTLSERFHLDETQVRINQVLSRLHRLSVRPTSQPEAQTFPPPRPDHYNKQLTSLAYLTKAHQHVKTLPIEKRSAMESANTHELNDLETQTFYDLMTPVYIAQLKEYRKQSSEKVMSVLEHIEHLGQRLQTQELYREAYSLYYRTLYELRVNQSFYATTYLKTVDERFLLKQLVSLQTACLEKETPSDKITSLWSENIIQLQRLRDEKKAVVDKLIVSIDQLRYSPPLIDAVETLQHDITQSMKTFIADLFKQAENLLGEPPCDYCLIALGSIARGDATPFSDLESVLLLEKTYPKDSFERLYFETLWKLVAFQVKALGESDDCKGFHIDGECHPLIMEDLINTPDGLIDAYGLRNVTTDESGNGRLALTLLNSTIVYEHEEKTETLWETYLRLLNKQLDTEKNAADLTLLLRHQKANAQLQNHLESFKSKTILDFNTDRLMEKTPEGPLAHLAINPDEEPGCSVKRDFLAPLAYLLADLSFYHHLDKTNHADIFQQLVEKNILDLTFAAHCRAAIAELNLFRLHLHFQHSQAQDVFPKELPHQQQERLKHLWLGLLKPLYHVAEQLTQPAEPIHPVFDSLSRLTDETLPEDEEKQKETLSPLLHYLLYTQSPEKPFALFIDAYHRLPIRWRPLFLKQIEEIALWPIASRYQQETLTTLEAQPNPDGWQPRMEKEKKGWDTTLLSLVEPLDPGMLAEAIASQTFIVYMPSSTGIGLKAYRFKPTIYKQLFNSDASLKPKDETQPGRHHLLSILYEGKRFWLKFTPEQPGTEFAINRLERYLGGQNTPMTHIIKISHGKNPGMAIQVSEHVSGSTLEEALKEAPESVCKIDMTSFTETLLRVLLTNPEDDKGDDYFLVPTEHSNYFRLMRIDNERAYYQPDALTGVIIKTKKLEVKSALYCLNQMQEPLSPDILDAFMRLEPLSLLDRWMQELKEEHAHHRTLFIDNEVKQHFHNVHPGPSILGVPMGSGLSEELLTRLESMQEVIRLKGIHSVNGIDLLKAVQPQLAEYYEKGFKEHPAPDSSAKHTDAAQCVSNRLETINRLYNITPHGHRQSMLPTIKAASKSLRLKKELTENDVIHCIHSKALSPQQALDELHQLEEKRVDDIKKALLDETPASIEKFRKLRVRLRLLLLKEIIDEKTTTSNISVSQQKHLLKAIAGTPFHSLSLSAFQNTLTDTLLEPILEGTHKHLLVLDISHCSQLTERTFAVLAKRCPHLETLIVQDIKMDDHTLLLKEIPFPNLKTLTIDRCEPLTHLQLKAALLVHLNVNHCPRLIHIETGSLTLLEADLSYNAALTESGISQLSELPHRLQHVRVIGCSQLSPITFRERFPFWSTLPISHLTAAQCEALAEKITQKITPYHVTPKTLPEPLKEACFTVLSDWLIGWSPFPELLQKLLAALKDQYLSVREAATTALGQLTSHPELAPELLQPLLAAFKDKYWPVQKAAATALEQLAAHPEIAPKLLQPLLAALKDDENGGQVRKAAATALGKLVSHPEIAPKLAPELLQALLAALKDKDFEVREAAATALGQLASHPTLAPELLQALLAALKDKDSEVREAAATALGQLAPLAPELLQPLLAAFKHESWWVRKTAAKALGQLASAPELLQPLLAALKDEDGQGRKTAAKALGQLASHPELAPELLQPLLAALKDKDSDVRKTAAKALGQLAAHPELAPELLQPLLAALKDEDGEVRKAAATALGKLASHPEIAPKLLQPLLAALKDKYWWVREAVTTALGQLASHPTLAPELLQPLSAALKDESWRVRETAAKALEQLASHPTLAPELLQPLSAALKDKSWRVRQAATTALGQLTSHPELAPELLQALLAALKDKYPSVRQAAAIALGQLAPHPTLAPGLLQPLLAALKNDGSGVQQAVANALGSIIAIQPKLALMPMQKMYNNIGGGLQRSNNVKHGAIYGLGAIGEGLSFSKCLIHLDNILEQHQLSPSTEEETKPTVKQPRLTATHPFKQRVSLFEEDELAPGTRDKLQHLLLTALPSTGYTIGKSVSEGDCFFDATAQAFTELKDIRKQTIDSLRKICADHANELENKHPVTTLGSTKEDKEANWIFKALNRRHDLYQKYLHQVVFTAEETALLEIHHNIGDGLAVWGEQTIDAIILAKHFHITLHVIEVHDEVLDKPELPPILHQRIDETGIHPLENPNNTLYQASNTIHLIVGHNHFCPLLKAPTFTDAYEHHGFLKPPNTPPSMEEDNAKDPSPLMQPDNK